MRSKSHHSIFATVIIQCLPAQDLNTSALFVALTESSTPLFSNVPLMASAISLVSSEDILTIDWNLNANGVERRRNTKYFYEFNVTMSLYLCYFKTQKKKNLSVILHRWGSKRELPKCLSLVVQIVLTYLLLLCEVNNMHT